MPCCDPIEPLNALERYLQLSQSPWTSGGGGRCMNEPTRHSQSLSYAKLFAHDHLSAPEGQRYPLGDPYRGSAAPRRSVGVFLQTGPAPPILRGIEGSTSVRVDDRASLAMRSADLLRSASF